MSISQKKWFLIILTFFALTLVMMLPPIAQDSSYHRFADARMVFDVPNFANVVSNFPFLIIGWVGFLKVKRSSIANRLKRIYLMLFIGVFLTGLGSAYYHLAPDNWRLVFDRLPMTLVFMALFSATVAEMIDFSLGVCMFIPLIFIGLASVCWWYWGEKKGSGDLRFYGFVQFYPVLFIPLIITLFYNPNLKTTVVWLKWIVVWYAIAKVLEISDWELFRILGISGHTLKHLAAEASATYFIPLFKEKCRLHDIHPALK